LSAVAQQIVKDFIQMPDNLRTCTYPPGRGSMCSAVHVRALIERLRGRKRMSTSCSCAPLHTPVCISSRIENCGG
jgi:hypothetical protein